MSLISLCFSGWNSWGEWNTDCLCNHPFEFRARVCVNGQNDAECENTFGSPGIENRDPCGECKGIVEGCRDIFAGSGVNTECAGKFKIILLKKGTIEPNPYFAHRMLISLKNVEYPVGILVRREEVKVTQLCTPDEPNYYFFLFN